MTTTTATTTTAADPHAKIWAEGARIYNLRRAMCAWRTDPVDGRTRLVKDIARKYGASDRKITRAYLRVSGGFRPDPLADQDLDSYAAAWRDAIVKELRAYKATADHLFSVVLTARALLRRDALPQAEWRKGRQDAPQGARAPRVAAQRRAERMQRNWAWSL